MVRRASETSKFTPRQRSRENTGRVIPTHVTFEQAAQLLVQEGITDSITPDGVRYLARARAEDWPFGEKGSGKPYEYVRVSNARLMATGPLLDYLSKHPPGRKPASKPGESEGPGK